MQNAFQKYRPIPEYHTHVPDSCNEEDAIRYVMYWCEEIILPFYKLPEHYSDDDLEYHYGFSIELVLNEEVEYLKADYYESKHDNLNNKIQAQKLAAFEEYKCILSKYYTYRSLLKDELTKLENSALRIVQATSINPKNPFITSISLFEWCMSIKESLVLSKSQTQNDALTPDEPWLIKQPDDPEPAQDWYTPARYFARKHINNEASLASKRNILAQRVEKSLKEHGIYKRGGEKPPTADTILKAFSNVTLK
jgi:hypothetical protein